MKYFNTNIPFQSNFKKLSPFYFFSSLIMQLDESCYPVCLPTIQLELGISMSTAQWLITAFSIGSAAGSIPMMKIQS